MYKETLNQSLLGLLCVWWFLRLKGLHCATYQLLHLIHVDGLFSWWIILMSINFLIANYPNLTMSVRIINISRKFINGRPIKFCINSPSKVDWFRCQLIIHKRKKDYIFSHRKHRLLNRKFITLLRDWFQYFFLLNSSV